MQRGFIKIYRKLADSGILQDPELCAVFLHLLLHAASCPRTIVVGGVRVALSAGQVVVGRHKLAAALGFTERKIRTCLAALEKKETITQRATNRYTVVSIVKWELYQGSVNKYDQGPADGAGRSAERPTERPAECGQNGQQNDQPKTGKKPMKTDQTANGSARRGQQNGQPDSREAAGGTASGTTTNKNKKKSIYTNTQGKLTSGNPAPADGPDGVGEGSPVSEASVEFLELRAFYDEHARPEGAMTGFIEYKASKKAGTWPGFGVIQDAVNGFAGNDDSWKRGYAPGLARFLREQWWKKSPAQARTPGRMHPGHAETATASCPEWAAKGGDPTIRRNLEAARNVLARRAARGGP